MLHDILIILANLAAFIVAGALLSLGPYLIIFLLCMIPGFMLSGLICLLGDALFVGTSFHDPAMTVIGSISIALGVGFAVYLMTQMFTKTRTA